MGTPRKLDFSAEDREMAARALFVLEGRPPQGVDRSRLVERIICHVGATPAPDENESTIIAHEFSALAHFAMSRALDAQHAQPEVPESPILTPAASATRAEKDASDELFKIREAMHVVIAQLRLAADGRSRAEEAARRSATEASRLPGEDRPEASLPSQDQAASAALAKVEEAHQLLDEARELLASSKRLTLPGDPFPSMYGMTSTERSAELNRQIYRLWKAQVPILDIAHVVGTGSGSDEELRERMKKRIRAGAELLM